MIILPNNVRDLDTKNGFKKSQIFVYHVQVPLHFYKIRLNIIFATSVKCTNCKGNKILLGPSVIVMTTAQSLSVSVTATKCR